MLKDDLYSRVMGPYVKYWESISELLSRHIPHQSSILLEGFWLSNNWRINYECASIRTIVDVDPKDLIILPKSLHPSLSILHTHLFVTCLLGILFLCSLQTLQSIMFRWEGPKVMLWKIKRMRIIGRSMFDGGFLQEKEPRTMRNCIIIIGWSSGSTIMQTQNNGLKKNLSHFFFD
jgi:hypothetical protein